MNVCFVLPIFTRQPQGGYKMVFEYANRFALLGHRITILFINEEALKQFKIPNFIRKMGASYLTKIEPKWFDLNSNIKKKSAWGNRIDDVIANTDVCIATSIDTVDFVKDNFSKCKKIHFIQGHETWICDEKTVLASYQLDWSNVVISGWLKEIVDQYAVKPAYLIKNPIDLDVYQNIIPSKKRKQHSVSVLYHTNKNKGIKYAIEALYKLKQRYQDLTVEIFGIFDRPSELPEWFNYTKGATQKQTVDIYNKTKIYLCATVEEGYGLTGLEAMACGAVLVSTDYQGVHEYAVTEKNALLSPVKNVDALVDSMTRIFENEKLAETLRENAAETVEKFSWNFAVEKFLSVIEE